MATGSDGRTEEQDLAAGPFSAWLRQTQRAQTSEDGAKVPCGTCTACCRSSYFIHIEPDETRTLSRIPRELLFPAPGRPEGNVVLGYDERGHCPMLVDDRCSIYDDRPRTCRRFDCRVFPAAGLDPRDDGKVLIAVQVRRWRFDHPTPENEHQHAAVRAAANFLREHPECFPHGTPPRQAIELAALAIKVHDVFLDNDAPDVATVRTALQT